jgi:hypothetical protein
MVAVVIPRAVFEERLLERDRRAMPTKHGPRALPSHSGVW